MIMEIWWYSNKLIVHVLQRRMLLIVNLKYVGTIQESIAIEIVDHSSQYYYNASHLKYLIDHMKG